jgi:hypothetical protein
MAAIITARIAELTRINGICKTGMQTRDGAEILKKPISQEMLNRDLARLAYVAKDGTPRVVPIGFTWNGSEVVMCTATNAPKLVSDLHASGTYKMTPEQRVEWETEVRSLYDSMVRIVVKPTWAKLIDFDETLPTPVEELIRRRQERQQA